MNLKNYTAEDVMQTAVVIDSNRTVAHGKLLMERTNTDCLYVKGKDISSALFYKSDITKNNLKNIIADFAEPCKMSVVSSTDLAYILRLLYEENLFSLLVMKQGKCIGVITRDILRKDGFIQ